MAVVIQRRTTTLLSLMAATVAWGEWLQWEPWAVHWVSVSATLSSCRYSAFQLTVLLYLHTVLAT